MKVLIFRKIVGGAASSTNSESEGVAEERFDFYPWSRGTLVFKRGPALIFSQDNCHLAKELGMALKHLEYSPMLLNLSESKAILKNSKL